MSTMIQIRNVPQRVHRVLKARAAQQGLTLSDYLLREITRVAEHPTLDEVLDRIKQRSSVQVDIDPAAVVRADRDSR
jgi:plasmid stability protein